MIEYTLENLVFRSIMSLNFDLANEFKRIQDNSKEIKSFSDAYKTIDIFFNNSYLKGFFFQFQRINVTEKLEELKSVVALYICYFAMEYCCHKENPEGKELEWEYLKDYFPGINSDGVRPIHLAIKNKINRLEEIRGFYDEKIINPACYSDESHIYRGNIIQYLCKSCEIKKVLTGNKEHKKLYIHDLAPSITMIALKNISYLPNGNYIKRSKSGLTGNFANNIGESLSGGLYHKSISESIIFNRTKIEYKISSKEASKIAEIINLMAADDIYRQERLNKILLKYAKMFEWMNSSEATKKDYMRIAKLLSVYLEIPPFASDSYSDFEYAFFNAMKHDDRYTAYNIIFPIFSFFMVTFPWIVGLSCFLLFYKNETIKELNEIKEIISELEEIIEKDYDVLYKYFEIDKNKIWNCKSKNSAYQEYMKQYKRNKGSRDKKHNNNIIEWSKDCGLSLEETIELLMSTPKNIINIRSILEENGIKCPQTEWQKYFYLQMRTEKEYLNHLILARNEKEYVFHRVCESFSVN